MDKGHLLTDKQLVRVEKRLAEEYKKAEKEMRKRLKKQMSKYDVEQKAKHKLYMSGKLTLNEYGSWQTNQLMHSAWMSDLIDKYVDEQVKANQRASAIINGSLAEAYAENHNFATYEIERELKLDTAYTLYNKESVRNLQIGTKINVAKDKAWHNRKIQSALTQGILQGEGSDAIAERLLRIGIMDKNAAIRNARTMITAAQNEGRLDSFERAAGLGISLKKCWVATMDDRVRESHAELDGETVPIDEPFSNGLMYPADPSGDPEEVYNCRCTMISQLDGFERDVTDLGLRPAEVESYEDWKASRIARSKLADKMSGLAANKYHNIWKETVTPADYAAKKTKIPAKKQYFDDEIAKAQQYGKAGAEAHFKALKADLAKFEKEGKQYEALQRRQNALLGKNVKKSATGAEKLTGADAMYSQARKDAAVWARDGWSGARTSKEYRAADAYFEKTAKKVHAGRTAAESDAYKHYTWGSSPFNSPLAGFKGNRYTDFAGVNTFDIDVGGYGNRIRALTRLVEKSSYDRDFWIQTGQAEATLEGFLGIPYGSIKRMTEAELQQFVGEVKEIPQFISGSINKGGGTYVPHDVRFNIFCPKGSEALYVLEDGYFGKAEHEMILQRGGTYKITRIYYGTETNSGKRKLFVDMELRVEKGYNKFQQ